MGKSYFARYLTMKSLLFTFLLIMGVLWGAYSQSLCDTICQHPEEAPSFPGWPESFMQHAHGKIMPILSEYHKTDTIYLAGSLWVQLLINTSGQVKDVYFQLEPPSDLKDRLCNEFFRMPLWVPAKQHGKPVCSFAPYTIRCILWQE